MSFDRDLFLPVSKEDMDRRGWDGYDFLLITGDAYVDHPSFGPTIIGRVLEAEGYRVAILAQPDWRSPDALSLIHIFILLRALLSLLIHIEMRGEMRTRPNSKQ